MFKIIKDNILKLKLKNKHYKIATMFLLFIIFGGLFLGVERVYAIDIVGFARDSLLNALSWIMQGVTWVLIKIAFWALEYIKAIAQYNGFMDAPPVVLGWLMVRDIANMFFVVALLVIAFGTILGLEQYEWKRSLIKLVLAAIFINFSKLILQLIIDASQVVTITFYNAFADSAGGNFIEMFKMDSITKMISDPNSTKGNDEALAVQVFAASVMGVFMAGVVMVTMWAYLVILIARVVMLWILMVLSPLAFVLQTIPAGKKYADDFWQKFIHHVLVAPVMFFFLWLAFATLGNGNIATQVGINTSQSSQAGAEFQSAANLSKPAVSMSEATTWENLSSFAMAIGFLLAGLTFVQSLGVVGGGITQKATQFGMYAATIASGYAAGRWLVGKGTEGAKGVAKDYGKLAWGKTGDKWLNSQALKNIPIIGGAAGIGRKEAVKRLETLQEARRERYKAEGPTGAFGINKRLAPKKEEIAALEVQTEEMQRAKASEYAAMKSKAGQELFKGDVGKFYENKANQIQATLGVDVKTITDEKGKNLYAKVQEHVNNKDYDKAEGAMRVIEGELEKMAKAQDKTYDRRDIDRKSAIGTYLVKRELEERSAVEEAGTLEARRATIKGSFGHSYLKEEQEKLKGEKEKIDGKLLEEKKNELYLEHAVTQTLKSKDESKWQAMSEDQKKALVAKEISSFSDNQKKQLVEEVKKDTSAKSGLDIKASESISQIDKMKAYDKAGVYDKFAILGGEYEAIKSKRRVNKFQTELEGEQATAKDVSRAQEGKTTDNRRRWEQMKAIEAIEENDKLPLEDLHTDIKQKHDAIVAINEKEKKIGKLDSEDKKTRDSLVQSQAALFATHMKKWPGMLASVVAGLDESYKGVDVNDKENLGKLIAGGLAGKKWDEVRDDDGLIKTEQQIRGNFKEKESRLFRALSLGMKQAADNGFSTYYQQIGEGMDEFGNKKFGFSTTMKAGLGVKGNLGTGKLTNQKGEVMDGRQMREDLEKSMYLPGYNRHSADDARAWVVHDGSGRSLKYGREEYLRAMRSFALANESEIEDRSENDFWIMHGGRWGQRVWNQDKGEFNFSTNEMREGMALQMDDWAKRYNSAMGDTAKNAALAAGKAILKKHGVEGISGKDIAAVDANDIANFINTKITGLTDTTKRGVRIHSKDELIYADSDRITSKYANGLEMVKIKTEEEKKQEKKKGESGGSTPPTPPVPPSGGPTSGGGSTSGKGGSGLSEPEEVADENVSFGKNVPPPPPNYAKLDESMSKLHDVLNNLSAEMANMFANKAQMSSAEENRIKGIAKEAKVSSDSDAAADYTLGKTIVDAMESKDEKIRVEGNKTVDALTKDGKNTEILESLTGGGKLNEADVIRLGRAITLALKSMEKDNSGGTNKPKS